MNITFLQAAMPLQKRFDEHGKHSYPAAYEFTSHTLPVSTMKEFHYLVEKQAALGRCLLKGNVTRDLQHESRAGSTDRDEYTQWICLDADGMLGIADAEHFLSKLGLNNINYVLQWSSSAYLKRDNIIDDTFNAHIFMKLDKAVSPHRLKLWLKQHNLNSFDAKPTLTASHVALKWPLDITTCQNDKLLYIAPPDVHAPYEDALESPRIQFVQSQNNIDAIAVNALNLDNIDPEKIRKQEITLINELRLEKGLEKKRATAFTAKGTNVEYLPNPSKAKITGQKEDRGFVYFNLNGGDSWAYYHPQDNHEYIFNFKGEPTYRTEELLPNYYHERNKALGLKKSGGKIPVGFRGMQDGALYNGFYDPDSDTLELFMARKNSDVIAFLEQYHVVTDKLPTFRLLHDPNSTAPRIDVSAETVNLFTISDMEKNSVVDTRPTPTIDRLLAHVLGPQNVAHFINWLAFVIQTKQASGTGWVLQGAQGTGKGILFNRILRPMLGYHNAIQVRTANFEDNYNGFLENATLVGVDEVDIPESRKDKSIMANIKNYMTEPYISIRKMYANVYTVLNHCNFIFMSNQRNPIIVDRTDRRMNVADYQPNPIQITEDDLDALSDELSAFMHHMLAYPYNERQARTAAMTEAKEAMQELNETSVDQIANALILGKAATLHEFCESEKGVMDLDRKLMIQRYNQLVKEIVCDGRDRFTREDLQTIFAATVGNVPKSAAKFAKFLRHHGIKTGLVRIDGEARRGRLIVEWTDSADWFARTRRDYGVMKTVQPETDSDDKENSA